MKLLVYLYLFLFAFGLLPASEVNGQVVSVGRTFTCTPTSHLGILSTEADIKAPKAQD